MTDSSPITVPAVSYTPAAAPLVIWSIAGNDSGGGAGLAADLRAAHAAGVHLCPVIACVTAQSSVQVKSIEPVSTALLDIQLGVLQADMPPAAIKVGLLGSVELVQTLARRVRKLRAQWPDLPLIVDPVLRASSGGSFTRDGLIRAYREHLLPLTTLLTPNRAEALALLSEKTSPTGLPTPNQAELPLLAARLRMLGVGAVCITGGDLPPGHADASDTALALDWLDSEHASGWLALPRLPAPHNHGTGCTFATFAAAALARGFVPADAVVLAKMGTTDALQNGYAAGQGPGPVAAREGFATRPALLPRLSPGADLGEVAALASRWELAADASRQLRAGLYTLIDRAGQAAAVLAAGGPDLAALQLRFKRDAHKELDDEAFNIRVRAEIRETLTATRAAGVPLYVNDHWEAALAEQADGVHLGQEDLLTLGGAEREQLRQARADGLALGISSHSLWELCRAAAWQPDYIACGPVWPTTTKDMPWRPQGLGNLAWWAHMAPVPVVAIGGLLAPQQAAEVARSGAAAACLVRAVQADPAGQLPSFRLAWSEARAGGLPDPVPSWPQPSLGRA